MNKELFMLVKGVSGIFIFLLLLSCAGTKNDKNDTVSKAISQMDIYRAVLNAIPGNRSEIPASGDVALTVKNDSLQISLNAVGLTPGEHMVTLNMLTDNSDKTSCPDMQVDLNNDAIIDMGEARTIAGKKIALVKQNVLDTTYTQANFPNADAMGNMRFQTVVPWNDFKDSVSVNNGLNSWKLENCVIIVHGISPEIALPPSVHSEGNTSLQEEIPVLCGKIEKSQ
jgi:hypothetical protein